jgi:hypothetical protein
MTIIKSKTMERQLQKGQPPVYHRLSTCDDTLSVEDLLAYIEGNLSLPDKQKIEYIINEEGNEFYIDLLYDLKKRFYRNDANVKNVLEEIDLELEEMPTLKDGHICTEPSNREMQYQLNDILKIVKEISSKDTVQTAIAVITANDLQREQLTNEVKTIKRNMSVFSIKRFLNFLTLK